MFVVVVVVVDAILPVVAMGWLVDCWWSLLSMVILVWWVEVCQKLFFLIELRSVELLMP